MRNNEKCAILTAGAAVSKVANAAVNKFAGGEARKGIEFLYAERVRQLFFRNDEIRDRGLTAPDDVVRVTDLAYGEDPQQVLDVYYPAGPAGGEVNPPEEAQRASLFPVIVSVHGGGYVYGDKERYQYYCMSLAQRGFAVVNFSYRLAPEFRFPSQLEDTNAVMRFLCENAKTTSGVVCIPSGGNKTTSGVVLPLDLSNVFMVGDSAGVQIAVQYCVAVTEPAYAKKLSMDIPPFTLRACAFNCGLYVQDPRKDRMMMRCFFDGPAERYTEKMDYAGNLSKHFPPSFLMTSTGDFLRERAEPFAALLTGRGVENEVHVYGDDKNKPGHVFHCDFREPLAKICNDDECAFFRRHAK